MKIELDKKYRLAEVVIKDTVDDDSPNCLYFADGKLTGSEPFQTKGTELQDDYAEIEYSEEEITPEEDGDYASETKQQLIIATRKIAEEA